MVTHSNSEGDATGIGPEPADRSGPAAPSPESGADPSPVTRRVEILNRMGFHLRPIQLFVGVVQQFRAEVQVRCNGKGCNGRSFLDLMSLGAEVGHEMELVAWGADARQALDALADLVAARFYEEDEHGNPILRPAR